MTPSIWPENHRPSPSTWLRCALCGTTQRASAMDEIGHGRWLCNEDTATPLCHRLRVEVGAARPPTIPATA
jgi:hypothetical protein